MKEIFKEYDTFYKLNIFKSNITAIFTKRNAKNMSSYINKRSYLKSFLKNQNINKYPIYTYQTHSKNILNITVDTDLESIKNFKEYDGFCTNRKDVVLVTYYADCLPIYLYDKKKHVISLIHSGWRGTYQEILKEGIKNLLKEYKSRIEDIIVILGISIDYKDYEVKKDFYEKFLKKFSKKDLKNVFIHKDGKVFFDNRKLNENLSIKYGIIKKNIYTTKLDVISAKCNSYRKHKNKASRSAAIMSLQ